MNYDLDFDTSLLDYHASKVDDLPYLDLFHDDKLDFGEDRQDCADLADAASPNDVIGGLFDSIRSGSEAEEDAENDGEKYDADKLTETPITKGKSKNKKSKNVRKTPKEPKEKKVKKSEAPQQKVSEEPEAKRPRRSTRQYNLRETSIINRIETETRRAKPREPKPKSKPPPLSKYRRRTANSRERTRMAEINDAFEVLRKAIPDFPTDESSKLTKITTLRLAMNYIGALRDMLGYPELAAADDSTPMPSDFAASGSDSASPSTSASKLHTPSSAESKPTPCTHTNSKSVNSSFSSDVTLTKGSLNVPRSADPVLATVNTDPFSDFNLAAISFSSTVPSPGSSTTIPSPDNLSCINTNMNYCLSPGTINCLSPDSMSCVSPGLSLTCSSPGSSISDNATANYYGLPYVGLGNPLDSEGESVTSLS